MRWTIDITSTRYKISHENCTHFIHKYKNEFCVDVENGRGDQGHCLTTLPAMIKHKEFCYFIRCALKRHTIKCNDYSKLYLPNDILTQYQYAPRKGTAREDHNTQYKPELNQNVQWRLETHTKRTTKEDN